MAKPLKTLAVPPSTAETGGQEVLRAFIANGDLTISMIRGFDDPATWGLLLVDVIRHLGRTYAAEDGVSEDVVQAKILATISAELLDPTDLGTTTTLDN